MIDTVTDDPNRLVGRDDRRLSPAARRHAGLGEGVGNELRAAAAERPKPFAGHRRANGDVHVADRVGVANRPAAGRRARPRAGRVRPTPRSRRSRSEPGPAVRVARPTRRTDRDRPRRAPRRPPARSIRSPPGSSTARRSPRTTASTRSTVAADGGGEPSQAAQHAPRQRNRCSRKCRRVSRVVARPRARRGTCRRP